MSTDNNHSISRDKLLSFAKERRYKEMEIEGLGTIFVQSLTELERARIEAEMAQEAQENEFEFPVRLKARLICACVVDTEKHRIFSDMDVDAVLEMDSAITNRICEEINAHCSSAFSETAELAKK